MEEPPTIHVSVLVQEVLEWLNPQPGQILVDGTLGGGGHTRVLAQRVAPDGLIVALDRDPRALAAAERSLSGLCVKLVGASFSELPEVLAQLQVPAVQGVLLDLGLSSDQLADRERGFSFDSGGALDLRFDPTQGEPAWRLIERLDTDKLANVIFAYGEERHSRRIARAIHARRRSAPIRTAADLADTVRSVMPRRRGDRIDPATRTFQALRIAVNDELGALGEALRVVPDCLLSGGRLAVISFHSLEDRLVKEAFRGDPRYRALTRKPITANAVELNRNPRARSAKLRVAERVT